MTFDEFYDEIIMTLGGTLVDVELTEEDVLICFKKATRKFIQQGNNSYRRVFQPIDVIPGTKVYDIPVNLDTAVKVVRPTSSGFSITEDLFTQQIQNQFTPNGTTSGMSGTGYLEYEMTLQLIDRIRKYSAEDVDFQVDTFAHKVTFFNDASREETWLLDCYVNLDDVEYMEMDWIIRWATSEAKLMLGIAYRKFNELSGPQGTTSLSGSEYISDAREEQQDLLQTILDGTDGAIDSYGIYIG